MDEHSLGATQLRWQYEDLAQPLFERNRRFRTETCAHPASKAGAFVPPGYAVVVQNNGFGGTPLQTGAAPGAGVGVDNGQVIGGVDHRQGAVPP